MSTWSLPPPAPPNETPDLAQLFQQWNSAKAWHWLRAGHVPMTPSMLDTLARHTLVELGINLQNLQNAWHMRTSPMRDPWHLPLVRLPARADEPWPEQAQAIAETPVGLLAALVANGWNAFAPFVSMPPPGPGQEPREPALRHQWGIEIVLGLIGTTRIDEAWRLALADQMLRSEHCPPLEVLRERQVGLTKRSEAVSWWQAGFRYRFPLVARVCLDHGLAPADPWADWPAMNAEDGALWQALILERQVAPATAMAAGRRVRL